MARRVGLTFAAQSLVQVGIFFKTGASVCSALKSVWWRRKNVFHFCYVGDLGQQKKKKIDTRYNLRARMRGKCPELYTVCMCVFGCGKGLNPCQSLFSASRFEWKIYTQLPRWIPSLFVCVRKRKIYTSHQCWISVSKREMSCQEYIMVIGSRGFPKGEKPILARFLCLLSTEQWVSVSQLWAWHTDNYGGDGSWKRKTEWLTVW